MSVHSRDFVTSSTVIIVKKNNLETKYIFFGSLTAYQGGIFNMILLPKERKQNWLLSHNSTA